jgi:hypothetical protein
MNCACYSELCALMPADQAGLVLCHCLRSGGADEDCCLWPVPAKELLPQVRLELLGLPDCGCWRLPGFCQRHQQPAGIAAVVADPQSPAANTHGFACTWHEGVVWYFDA